MANMIIHNMFEETVSKYPENIAVSDGSQVVNYRELNASANQIAHLLIENGVGSQDIIGLYFDASIEYVMAVLGVLKAGAIFMPLNTQFPKARLRSILVKTRPDIFITSATHEGEFLEKFHRLEPSANQSHLLVLNDTGNLYIKKLPGGDLVTGNVTFPDDNPTVTSRPDDGCYLVTTSGSTGEPKAILGSQKGLSHFIRWEIAEFGINQDARVSLLSPVTFDVSLRDIFVPLISGGTLCIPDEETRHNPRRLLHWLRESRITLTHIIPTLFRLLTLEIRESGGGGDTLPDLKYALIAGEPLYGNDVTSWRQVCGNHTELVNLYGPSETTLAKLFYRIPGNNFEPDEIVPIGKPIPDTEVLIMAGNKRCRVGQTGEIFIKTPFMTKGYYNAPELNEVSFVQNPLVTDRQEIIYKTGDLGKMMSDSTIRFEGRLDGQIKIYGNRVEISEIEVVLRQHAQVREAVVAARQDNYGDIRLIGYIVPQPGQRPTVESLRRFLGEKLPDYMVPSIFIKLDALPLTHHGKIDRGALPEPERTRPELEQAYVSPGTAEEKILTEIWCRVLGLERVGVEDNFFDLGGTSILGVKLIGLVREEFKTDIPIVKLFQYPNIRSMAKYLDRSQSDELPFKDVQKRARRRRVALSSRKTISRRS